MASYPIPVPTPYQSPQNGGNPYLKPGTTGQVLGANDYPIASAPGGGVLFSSGVSYPSSSVVYGPTRPTPTPHNYNNTYISTPTPTYSAPAPAPSNNFNTDADRARQEAAAREAAIRNGINSGFDQYESRLSNLEGMYNTQQGEDTNLLNTTYGNLASGLQTGYDQGVQKLNGARTEVGNRTKASTADVAMQLRNMLKATGMQLGAMGAGDSSAAKVFAPYAYSKIAARENGNIYRQANDQYGQLDQKGIDLQSEYTAHKNDLDQWKYDQLSTIRDKYLNLIGNIRQLKANAPVERVNALNQLESGLLDRARQEADAIESEHRQYAYNLDLAMRQAQGNNTNYLSDLAKTAAYNVTNPVYNNLPSASIGTTGNSMDQTFINPYLFYQKRDQTGQNVQ